MLVQQINVPSHAVAKKGVGFAPKFKKKNNKKKTKQTAGLWKQTREGTTHGNKKDEAKGGNATKGNTPLPNTTDHFSLLALMMSTLHGSFGFLRTLLLT